MENENVWSDGKPQKRLARCSDVVQRTYRVANDAPRLVVGLEILMWMGFDGGKILPSVKQLYLRRREIDVMF